MRGSAVQCFSLLSLDVQAVLDYKFFLL